MASPFIVDDGGTSPDDLLLSYPCIYERLAQVPGYTWDSAVPPFHSVWSP